MSSLSVFYHLARWQHTYLLRCESGLVRRSTDLLHWGNDFLYIPFKSSAISYFLVGLDQSCCIISTNLLVFQFAIGCVIVDPSKEVVVARSCDRRKIHPLQHAVMMCIDRVALMQGGGVWDTGRGKPTLYWNVHRLRTICCCMLWNLNCALMVG